MPIAGPRLSFHTTESILVSQDIISHLLNLKTISRTICLHVRSQKNTRRHRKSLQLHFPFNRYAFLFIAVLGALCTRNAFWNRKNRVFAVFDRIISAGEQFAWLSTSTIVTYPFQFFPTKRKLVYCSRTVPEIEKALAELKRLMEYRIQCAETEEQKTKERNFMGLGLTSRKNLCINPEVSKWMLPLLR